MNKTTGFPITIQTLYYTLVPGGDGLWTYQVRSSGRTIPVYPPQFEIDGRLVDAWVLDWQLVGEPRALPNGCQEIVLQGLIPSQPELVLTLTFRIAADNPFVRFRYALHSQASCQLTRSTAADRLCYTRLDFSSYPRVQEIKLSGYSRLLHSYVLAEDDITETDFQHSMEVMGPLLVGSGDQAAVALAYEHGSQAPDAFLKFCLGPDRKVALKAVRGNYPGGFDLTQPYHTLWFQLGGVEASVADLARHYRTFILNRFALHDTSRQPYIYYNTWNFQERNRHWYSKDYLADMNLPRMLAEIDVAHRLGVEVFVIDTGWYEKTGDWQVNLERFPDGLQRVKARLDNYGMQLGLWFNPTMAAVSSSMAAGHPECLKLKGGQPYAPAPVWQTEASQPYCLISRFGQDLIERLIEFYRQLGVTYFKWDGVETYAWGESGRSACDAAQHGHGSEANTPQERSDCAAFQFPLAMVAMVERLIEACPQAIVDFDVTEAGRAVGLAFLSVGKYFLINNGPYFQDYNIPLPPDGNWNMLFYPGPARTWFCRAPLAYDRWIPSILFMSHFLPDEPRDSQLLNLASLVLGGNGLWGDLPAVSPAGVEQIASLVSAYKQVRADITAGSSIRSGEVSTSPEIYEKINQLNGRGVVALFTNSPESVHYISKEPVSSDYIASDGVRVSFFSDRHAVVDMNAAGSSTTGLVFFGAKV
jgi:alpha-galactosidase